MLNLEIDQSDIDFLTQAGREPAICELRCGNCAAGLKFDQHRCTVCGQVNLRFRVPEVPDFDPARPIAAKSIP